MAGRVAGGGRGWGGGGGWGMGGYSSFSHRNLLWEWGVSCRN